MLYDKDIREPLFDYFLERYGKVRALEEKIIGKSRADMVFVLPDALCGVEIKSDADSYTRLESQVKDYDRFFDVNYVVVGSSHGMHISEHVPSYWGIITVEETEYALTEDVERIYTIIDPTVNGEPLELGKTYRVASGFHIDETEETEPLLSSMEEAAAAMGEYLRSGNAVILPDVPLPDHRIVPMDEVPVDTVSYDVTVKTEKEPQ